MEWLLKYICCGKVTTIQNKIVGDVWMSKNSNYVEDEIGGCANYPMGCWNCIYQGNSGQLCNKIYLKSTKTKTTIYKEGG